MRFQTLRDTARLGSATAALLWAVALMIVYMGLSPANADQTGMERLGPKKDASIFWVGHSLVEGKAKTDDWGEIDLMGLVGRFAEARGLGHRMGEHTLWGSPLSALWRGRPHGFDRDASEMVAKREAYEGSAGQFDTLVLTESLPVNWAVDHEFSAYYVRRFACPMIEKNAQARVYLYQTWVNFQGNDPNSKFPPPHLFDWTAEMKAQRKVWENIADAASHPNVPAPGGWLSRLGWPATGDGGCPRKLPVFIVPVGQAMLALSERLAAPFAGDMFALPGGGKLSMADLFANPYVEWPADWPLAKSAPDIDPAASLARLTRRDPDRPLDDIHASAIGIYFAALVHFATIYRQSPEGLPAPADVGDDLARTLQCIVWNTVVSDPRSGVHGRADCGA